MASFWKKIRTIKKFCEFGVLANQFQQIREQMDSECEKYYG